MREENFEELLKLYRPRIFHYALRKTGDEEAASDITQETLLKAFRGLSSFRDESSFYTWLYRIAHNEIVNFLKQKRREVELPPTLEAPEVAQAPEGFDEALNAGLQELPEKQRIVFELYMLKKMPQKEIAAQLNLSYGTVRSRLYYARKKIRAYLEKYLPK